MTAPAPPTVGKRLRFRRVLSAPPLVFLHIPKTAGTTLSGIMNGLYPPRLVHTLRTPDVPGKIAEFRAWPEAKRHRIRLLRGHQPFGLHELLAPGARYITVLRHPVARVASHYEYLRSNPDHFMHRRLVDSGLTLADYARSRLFPELDNGQVRQIAGVVDDDRPMGRTDLQQAIANLDRHFDWIGLTEHFDESLVTLAARMGWLDVRYRKQNVGKRAAALAPDAATAAAIESANALDLELYRYTAQRFASANPPVRWLRSLGAAALRVANRFTGTPSL